MEVPFKTTWALPEFDGMVFMTVEEMAKVRQDGC